MVAKLKVSEYWHPETLSYNVDDEGRQFAAGCGVDSSTLWESPSDERPAGSPAAGPPRIVNLDDATSL